MKQLLIGTKLQEHVKNSVNNSKKVATASRTYLSSWYHMIEGSLVHLASSGFYKWCSLEEKLAQNQMESSWSRSKENQMEPWKNQKQCEI